METMDSGRIALPCPPCGRVIRLPRGGTPELISCPGCGESVAAPGGPAISGSAPDRCHVCGSPHLYWQKEFNQKIGCLFVLAGALLVPWTYGLSLGVVALIDLVFYRMLPRVSVCYICRARYQGVPPHEDHAPYNLIIAQTNEARTLSWKDGKRRPAYAPG